MLHKKYTNEICANCLRNHCVNKNTSNAKPNKTCFIESGCSTCSLISLCCNKLKEKEVFELAARFHEGSLVPTCFVKPTCEQCFKSYHCKKKNINSFELNPVDLSNPKCFSRFHSTK